MAHILSFFAGAYIAPKIFSYLFPEKKDNNAVAESFSLSDVDLTAKVNGVTYRFPYFDSIDILDENKIMLDKTYHWIPRLVDQNRQVFSKDFLASDMLKTNDGDPKLRFEISKANEIIFMSTPNKLVMTVNVVVEYYEGCPHLPEDDIIDEAGVYFQQNLEDGIAYSTVTIYLPTNAFYYIYIDAMYANIKFLSMDLSNSDFMFKRIHSIKANSCLFGSMEIEAAYGKVEMNDVTFEDSVDFEICGDDEVSFDDCYFGETVDMGMVDQKSTFDKCNFVKGFTITTIDGNVEMREIEVGVEYSGLVQTNNGDLILGQYDQTYSLIQFRSSWNGSLHGCSEDPVNFVSINGQNFLNSKRIKVDVEKKSQI